MDAKSEARASLAICLGKLDSVGRLQGTAAGDCELVACDVVLCTSGGTGSMESNSLSAEEVIARG